MVLHEGRAANVSVDAKKDLTAEYAEARGAEPFNSTTELDIDQISDVSARQQLKWLFLCEPQRPRR